MTTTPYDVVLFGATSFVGRITARYLLDQFGIGRELRWAAAGRSMPRLDALRVALGEGASDLPLLAVDASDEANLRAMCLATRVVATTVGPYALHGESLVKCCAETGTGYCDLTGEVHWMRRMIDRYERAATTSGARIVHACGFDSIPSDLGVHFLQGQAGQRFGQPCARVKMRVRAAKGGLSGGTAASMLNLVGEAAADPVLRRQLGNPYLLCPTGFSPGVRQPEVRFAEWDDDFGEWVAPFVMSAVNTRVVHRSNVLLDEAYGREFQYDEALLTGSGTAGWAAAAAVATATTGVTVAGAFGPTRWLIEQFLPAPGQGPSPDAQARGFFDLRFVGRTAAGQRLRTTVTGDRDPGYGSTAKMLGQAAACLAQDVPGVPGGFWTPATLFGDRLVERLRAQAGLTFEVAG